MLKVVNLIIVRIIRNMKHGLRDWVSYHLSVYTGHTRIIMGIINFSEQYRSSLGLGTY